MTAPLPAAAGHPAPEAEAEQPSRLAAVVAEVETEIEADAQAVEDPDLPEGAVAVPFAGTTVHVLDHNDWRSSAQTALTQGRFDDWAELCLATESDKDLWFDTDPSLREIENFFDALREITGQDEGKSRASRRGLARAQRRRR